LTHTFSDLQSPNNFATQNSKITSESINNIHKKIKVLSLNCCSLRSNLKKASFLALINEHNPDVLCGCESHLDESYLSAEIFHNEFNVFRKDSIEGASGVFICIKKSVSS